MPVGLVIAAALQLIGVMLAFTVATVAFGVLGFLAVLAALLIWIGVEVMPDAESEDGRPS